MFEVFCSACCRHFRVSKVPRDRKVQCTHCRAPVDCRNNAVKAPPIAPPAIPAAYRFTRRRSRWIIAAQLAAQGLFVLASVLGLVFATVLVIVVGLVSIYPWWSLIAPLCALIGARAGSRRDHAINGYLLGLFLGPIGLLGVLLLDGRPTCPECDERISRRAAKCPHCRSELIERAQLPALAS